MDHTAIKEWELFTACDRKEPFLQPGVKSRTGSLPTEQGSKDGEMNREEGKKRVLK